MHPREPNSTDTFICPLTGGGDRRTEAHDVEHAAAGIRSNAGVRPMADARELKALRKERRSAARKQRRDGTPAPTPLPSLAPSLDGGPSGPSPAVPSNF